MSESIGEELIERIRNAAGLILGVSENRSWIEFFFEGDLMHTKTVNLPGIRFSISMSRKFPIKLRSTSIPAPWFSSPARATLKSSATAIKSLSEGQNSETPALSKSP